MSGYDAAGDCGVSSVGVWRCGAAMKDPQIEAARRVLEAAARVYGDVTQDDQVGEGLEILARCTDELAALYGAKRLVG